jgi:hypothetical protein
MRKTSTWRLHQEDRHGEIVMKKIAVLAALVSLGTVSAVQASPITIQGVGDLAAITFLRDSFRTAVGGGIAAGANGSFGGLRREINWDGVPDAASAPNAFPANFFNVNSPRGAVFSTPVTGFQVSANAGVAPVEFGNINATYPGTFATFSPQRLFTALGSTITDVNFFLPGTTTPALTSAFGAIFTDVDMTGSSIQYFDALNNSLGLFAVPSLLGSETFSFLGVVFDSPVVSRVRIISGNTALGPNDNPGGGIDVAVMDDFIYAEPTAVPEPATLILTGAGFAVLGLRKRRRTRG